MKNIIGKLLFIVAKYMFSCIIVYIKNKFINKERGNLKMATTKSTTSTILSNAAAILLAYLANKASDDNTSWATYRNALITSSLSSITSALAEKTTDDTTAQ